MVEQIGLQAVLEMSNFNDGVKIYLSATAKMDKTTASAAKTTKNFADTIGGKIMTGALEKAGHMFTQFVSELPQMAMELYNLGAQVEAVQYRFEAFAGGPEEATKYLDAFSNAAGGTIDRMGAMQGATKLLQMGLVSNADEMETMARIAIKLGDQTAQAGDRMSDFALLLANQSILRLDNFGISSGKVRKRIEELQKATKDMTREEAFKIAVMEEGAKSLEKLGDTTELAKTKTDSITASLANLKQTAGTMFKDLASDVEVFGYSLDDIPETIGWAERALRAWGVAQKEFWKNGVMPGISGSIDAVEAFNNTMKQLDPEVVNARTSTEQLRYAHITLGEQANNSAKRMNDYNDAINNSAKAADDAALAYYEEHKEISAVAYVSEATKKALNNQVLSQDALMKKVLDATKAIENEKQAMVDTAAATLTLSMTFTDYQRDIEQSVMEHAQTIENIEIEHQGALAELKTQGKDTDIALENERYAEKLRLAQEAYALEQEEQRRHLGEMILQSFDAWVQINGGVTTETVKMRTALAEEYGLVEAGSTTFVENMLTTFDAWATNQNVSTDAVISRLDTAANSAFNLKTAIENLPSSKEIVITYTEQGGREASWGGTGPSMTEFAEGGTSQGGMAMVGERGPELVNLPRGAQVMNTTDTTKLFKTVSMMLQSNTPVSQIMNNQKSINVPISATINNDMDMFAFQARVQQAVAGAF